MKWPIVTVPLVVLVVASIPSTPTRMSSTVDRENLQLRLAVPVSPNVSDMQVALQQLADRTDLLLGFEAVATAWQRPSAPESRVEIPIESAADGLTYLAGLDARYAWHPGPSVVHFRPKMIGHGEHFLHTPLRIFKAEHITAEEVLTQIHRALDPGYAFRPPPPGRPLPSSALRRVTFTLENTRIVDVLDELVRTHPEVNVWSVTYRATPAVYGNAMIAVRSWDGWMTSLPARMPE